MTLNAEMEGAAVQQRLKAVTGHDLSSCEPLPYHSSLIFFRSSKDERLSHSIHRVSQENMPPTSPSPDPATISARSRRSSISAIPHPAAGTSRRATPSSIGSNRAGFHLSKTSLSPERHHHLHHTNSGTATECLPPSSMPSAQSSAFDSAPCLPYSLRQPHNRACVRAHPNDYNVSCSSLNGSDVAASHQMRNGFTLPKSNTISNLISLSRDITPKRLLQPLGPPLPRTQTLGNITCFGSTNSTPSPRKPTSVNISHLKRHQDDESQLDITTALSESRMTDEEVGVMRQVQREAAINRVRLRERSREGCEASRNLSPSTSCRRGTIETNKMTPSITIPMGANAAGPLPAEVQNKAGKRQHLSINPTLANSYCIDHDQSTATTTTSDTGSTQSGPFLERLKQVCLYIC